MPTPSIKILFDRTNPAALLEAQVRAAKLVTNITETMRKEMRKTIADAFKEGRDTQSLADEIYKLVGDEARADLIARTETLKAANVGQSVLFDQAVEKGLLTGREKKEWIVTPDDRLCPICEEMDGVIIPIDDDFEVDGESISEPPAHPNCRCTIGLSM